MAQKMERVLDGRLNVRAREDYVRYFNELISLAQQYTATHFDWKLSLGARKEGSDSLAFVWHDKGLPMVLALPRLIKCPWHLFQVAHEVGHVVLRHGQRRLCEGQVEREANDWALDYFNRCGLKITFTILFYTGTYQRVACPRAFNDKKTDQS